MAFRRLHGLPVEMLSPVSAADESALLYAARRHHVTGLLYDAGGDAYSLPAWRSSTLGQIQHTARLTIEAERLFGALTTGVGDVSIIKGPAIAAQAWPNAGLRSFDDLDFRCPRTAYPALCDVMQRAGYQSTIPDARMRANLWHFGWGIAFQNADGDLVECNHRFFPPHYPWPAHIQQEDLAHFVMQPLETHAVLMPSPSLHLLLACMHACWHGGGRLAWFVDIAGLLVRHPEALDQADQWIDTNGFARRALHTCCQVADHLFGLELALCPPCAFAEPVVETLLASLQADPTADPSERLHDTHLALMNPRERIIYNSRRALIPGDGDFRRLSLPGAMRPLYYLYRPFRILTTR